MGTKSRRPLPPLARLLALFSYDSASGELRSLKTGRIAGAVNGRRSPYRRVSVDGRHYLYHRVCFVMATGVDPGELLVDHINRDTTDNRAENLRAVTDAESARNKNPFYSPYNTEKRNIRALPVGGIAAFPIDRLASLRVRASQLKASYGLRFTVRKRDGEVVVARLA